jgi:hypothetical protein
MLLGMSDPAQVPEQPIAVYGLPVGFALPVAIVGIFAVMITIMYCVSILGTEAGHREIVIEAFAKVVKATGDAMRGLLDGVARLLRGHGR